MPGEVIGGTIQNDLLKEYIARGTYVYPPRQSMRIITDIFAYCREGCPGGTRSRSPATTSVRRARPRCRRSPSPWPTASPTSQAAMDAGLDVDDFAPRLSFFWNAHNNFFEEIAKFRAARRMWYRIMTERFGATGGEVEAAAVPHADRRVDAHGAAAGEQHHARHAAGAGRGDGRHPEPAHQRLRRSARSADRAGGHARAAHPAGRRLRVRHGRHHRSAGRFVLRRDAHRRGRSGLGVHREDRRMGGAVAAIEAGFLQDEIEQAAYAYTKAIDDGEKVIVGVNRFDTDVRREPEVFPIDPELQRQQVERLGRSVPSATTG